MTAGSGSFNGASETAGQQKGTLKASAPTFSFPARPWMRCEGFSGVLWILRKDLPGFQGHVRQWVDKCDRNTVRIGEHAVPESGSGCVLLQHKQHIDAGMSGYSVPDGAGHESFAPVRRIEITLAEKAVRIRMAARRRADDEKPCFAAVDKDRDHVYHGWVRYFCIASMRPGTGKFCGRVNRNTARVHRSSGCKALRAGRMFYLNCQNLRRILGRLSLHIPQKCRGMTRCPP